MRLAALMSAGAAIAGKPYAESIILHAHITRDQRDDARCKAPDRVAEASRGL
jgi:hypothetical protein